MRFKVGLHTDTSEKNATFMLWLEPALLMDGCISSNIASSSITRIGPANLRIQKLSSVLTLLLAYIQRTP